MKTLTPTSIATGLIAGVTAALLSLSANAQSSLAIVLYAASALPILIAGLGWGNASALIAVLAGGVVASALVSSYFALMIVIITLIPAGWLSNLANLARPASELGGPEDALAWYPLSNILVHLAIMVTLGMIAVGAIVGYDSAMASQLVDIVIQTLKAQEPLYNPDAAAVAQMKTIFALALPLVQGALWVFLLFAAYYIASFIVRLSGKGLRPREDMPSTLRMHRNAIFFFLGGLVCTFLGGVPAIIGALVCGTFGAGFVLAGFASLHFRTRGKPWRLFALWFAYLSVLLLTIPVFAILILGLLDTRRTIALTPAGPATKKNQNI
ncbi:YybS family protein [Shinella kummerowiae]|uniref:YybS family protein n=1 Tax=Shinella kummerowiae TaxID=417745 RepID=UPI0021B6568C|nr:YybS family protein [Shinella kummerowiae]